MKRCAPIIFFCYNRSDKVKSTIEALKSNPEASETDLYIFCDGPKSDEDLPAVKEVRETISKISGFRNIELNISEVNNGCANSIIAGVTSVLDREESAIIVEDDVRVSPFFLSYMNDALNLYKDNQSVGSISSYNFSTMKPQKLGSDTFLLRITNPWGWATWSRAWQYFNPDASYLLDQIRSQNLESKFDMLFPVNWRSNLLELQVKGEIDAWDIRWSTSLFLRGMYTLYPHQSLVSNIGLDGSGTHGDTFYEGFSVASSTINLSRISIEENPYAVKKLQRYFERKYGKKSWLRKFVKRMLKYARLKKLSGRL